MSIARIASHIRLSELAGKIEKVIADNFSKSTFWVIAEVSGLTYYSGKNYYFFDLVEKSPGSNSIQTCIKTSAWSTAVNNIRLFERTTGQKFDNNIEVLVEVKVDYHKTFGLKLNLIDIDTSFTVGKLELERQATLLKLVRENPLHIKLIDGKYISFNRNLTISPVIQRIALITSENSDGFRDFNHELLNNLYGYKFQVDKYFTQVQGQGVDLNIVNKLVEIFSVGIGYDAVVIVRGGGSAGDFITFDSYALSRAIARFPVPVICGIGHTRNETISDMMAYISVKTPTKAASFIIDHNRAFEERLAVLQVSVSNSVVANIRSSADLLNNTRAEVIRLSKDLLSGHQAKITGLRPAISRKALENISARKKVLLPLQSRLSQNSLQLIHGHQFQVKKQIFTITASAKKSFTANNVRLDVFKNLIRHVGPESILKRGYALVFQNGKLVRNALDIQPGSEIQTKFVNSEIISKVTKTNSTHGSSNDI